MSYDFLCDVPAGPDCNIDYSKSFANKYYKRLEYPGDCNSSNSSCSSSDGDNGDDYQTLVDEVLYDYAVAWNAEAGLDLDFNFDIIPKKQNYNLDCTKSKIWVGGTTIDAELAFKSNGHEYCHFDLNGKLTRVQLTNPVQVVFLFKDLIDDRKKFYVNRNTDEDVFPVEDRVFYRFWKESASISSTVESGFTTIELDIQNITHTSDGFDPNACASMDDIMESVSVGVCTLNAEPSSTPGNYIYKLPREDYESCANSITETGDNIEYFTKLTLPVQISDCYYFQDHNNEQDINVVLSKTYTTQTEQDLDHFSMAITGYGVERAEPLSLYVTPQVHVLIELSVVFEGTGVGFTGLPYLDNPSNTLSVFNETCTVHSSGNGNVCNYVLRSNVPTPIYELVNGGCSLESLNRHILYDIGMEEYNYGQALQTVTHNVIGMDTTLEVEEFSSDKCTTPDDNILVNVTDSYTSVAEIRNTGTDWNLPPGDQVFYEPVIVRLKLTDSNLVSTEIQIVSLDINVVDPSTDNVITSYVFNKGDKVALLDADYTRYFDDVHFCSYHDEDQSTCEPFYQDHGERNTDYINNTIIPELPTICETNIDDSNEDYFTFTPTKWFLDINIPVVRLDVTVTSVIVDCSGPSSRRLLSDNRINYVSTKQSISARTTPQNSEPSTQPPTVPGSIDVEAATLSTGALAGIISGSVVGALILVYIGYYMYKKRKVSTAGYAYASSRHIDF